METEQPALKIKKLRPEAITPRRATPGATGLDLFACIEGDGLVALVTQPRLVGTGIAIEVPRGYDVQIRPRSGLSLRASGSPSGLLTAITGAR